VAERLLDESPGQDGEDKGKGDGEESGREGKRVGRGDAEIGEQGPVP
jgi:hypothetical protein